MKKSLTITGIILLTAFTAYPVFARGPAWSGNHEMRTAATGTGYHHMARGAGHKRFQHIDTEEICWNNQTRQQGPKEHRRNMGSQTNHMEKF